MQILHCRNVTPQQFGVKIPYAAIGAQEQNQIAEDHWVMFVATGIHLLR
jgi:hypothetical protein